jgi:hypothetical protein
VSEDSSGYRHQVTGIYPDRERTEQTLNRLVEAGLPRDRFEVVEPHQPVAKRATSASSDSVLKDVLVDTAVGTAIGTGAGALGAAAIAAANISLFVASPLIGTLTMLGWGAGVGGMAGAAIGAGNRERKFSDLVKDVTDNGYFVLVAHTETQQQTELARRIIADSVKDSDNGDTIMGG